jgi:hypothetical protein
MITTTTVDVKIPAKPSLPIHFPGASPATPLATLALPSFHRRPPSWPTAALAGRETRRWLNIRAGGVVSPSHEGLRQPP